MRYKTVKNPRWANQEHTLIDCDVDFDDILEEFVPFTASPTDIYDHTKEIWRRCLSGEFGEIAEWVDPRPPVDAIPVIDVTPTQG